jgi:hypothetical protein
MAIFHDRPRNVPGTQVSLGVDIWLLRRGLHVPEVKGPADRKSPPAGEERKILFTEFADLTALL